ncbi:putative transcription factor KAN2 [Morella rubra]|uniref:Putative transcription factor KAN2 n=1 Tax=Morella rubra TaxID=262757 RepID=A0A6A1VDL7_9ROSI|nr:putative transcription factor KAN2 [Morella rubra]
MELFLQQPDLFLQISPPNSKPTTSWRRSTQDELDFGFCNRALDSRNSMASMAKPDTFFVPLIIILGVVATPLTITEAFAFIALGGYTGDFVNFDPSDRNG